MVKTLAITAVFAAFLQSNNSFSQSAWDIVFAPIDSINHTFIEKKIYLDFKSQSKLDTNFQSLFFLAREDSAILFIDARQFQFVEKRKIYDDWGICSEQSLVSTQKVRNGFNLKISEVSIVEISKDSLRVNGEFTLLKKGKRKTLEKPGSKIDFWVERFKLNGVFFKK